MDDNNWIQKHMQKNWSKQVLLMLIDDKDSYLESLLESFESGTIWLKLDGLIPSIPTELQYNPPASVICMFLDSKKCFEVLLNHSNKEV